MKEVDNIKLKDGDNFESKDGDIIKTIFSINDFVYLMLSKQTAEKLTYQVKQFCVHCTINMLWCSFKYLKPLHKSYSRVPKPKSKNNNIPSWRWGNENNKNVYLTCYLN